MHTMPAVLALGTLCVSVCGCGGATMPTSLGSAAAPTPSAASAVVRIEVAEINGPNSFFPSPATARSGQAIVWSNTDRVTHRLVLDDGSVDTGTLAPSTLSQPLSVGVGTRTYHCTIHPTMVGTVIVTAASASSN